MTRRRSTSRRRRATTSSAGERRRGRRAAHPADGPRSIPRSSVRPARQQVDDLLEEIRSAAWRDERVLVTTLTKKMAEDLTDYLPGARRPGALPALRHRDASSAVEIIRDLRKGTFDVLVGINLLREGLDLPEVSLVAILDADKEGFLRSERSLIQTIGRAARNVQRHGASCTPTPSPSRCARAIDETDRRRAVQAAYNEAHGITPQTIRKAISDPLVVACEARLRHGPGGRRRLGGRRARPIRPRSPSAIAALRGEMREAARQLEFERAASLRDEIRGLEERLLGVQVPEAEPARLGPARTARSRFRPGPGRIGAACPARREPRAHPSVTSRRSTSAWRPSRQARACTC